ncbi:hypothetical protein OHA79_05340 [Streptomyces sp. NBC_00841]|uniref:hypothetical protein n=1 Tax=Streptomyces sp. NBC_00841 TaxID=2975847 RepID=UPI002DD856CA|nr:hypothetical protein [Streptomyces sp. NBC_00841]WRZ97349.1 hypothetical protein OHA79_05340 [Streptomyces sp. NBC_00841]
MRTSDGEAAYLKVTPATLGAQPLAAARDTGTVTVAYGTPASTDMAYGTDCAHEHACVRCPVLIVSPKERPGLLEMRRNLMDRIAEAEREGWLGEAEGLSVSLPAAEEEIAQLDAREERQKSPIFLGVPALFEAADRTTSPFPLQRLDDSASKEAE